MTDTRALLELLVYAEKHGLPLRMDTGMLRTVDLACCNPPGANCMKYVDVAVLCEEAGVEWADETRDCKWPPNWACDGMGVLTRPFTLSEDGR